MPDAIELLKTRRSMKPREMTGPGPSPAEIDTILTIGARVPDHGKLAPWRFILFEGDARARAGEIIAKVFARKNPRASANESPSVSGRKLARSRCATSTVSDSHPPDSSVIWTLILMPLSSVSLR